ncbi:MAG TPA: hypothetical protein VF043_33055 [Ktedonobacteraceae bacterium]
MTLEEAEKEFTHEHRTAINTVGANEIVVKKRLPDTAEKPYVAYYVRDPQKPFAYNGGLLGEYSTLEEVKNHFIGLSFAPEIDPNRWVVSPEEG